MPRDLPEERQVAVWKFLSFATSTEQAALMSGLTGYVPVRESARITLLTGKFYRIEPEFSVAVDQLRFAREYPSDPRWSSGWGIFGDAVTSVLRDDAPVLETLTAAEQRMNELLQP
jgi:ABC-type glycerol-3-phosphate transport system substrate-binding protein